MNASFTSYIGSDFFRFLIGVASSVTILFLASACSHDLSGWREGYTEWAGSEIPAKNGRSYSPTTSINREYQADEESDWLSDASKKAPASNLTQEHGHSQIKYRVIIDSSPMYKEANSSSELIKNLKIYELLFYLETSQEGWLQVKDSTGTTGFMHSIALKKEDLSPPSYPKNAPSVTTGYVSPEDNSESNFSPECLKLIAALRVCEETNSLLNIACEELAKSKFTCSLPIADLYDEIRK
jgi:hypothetical protein